uniref:Uncharacterized protein n=1 Tax=uncultured SAR11 cluster alpha proteobacterium H17925_45G17 TaxID=715038 RepID=E7CA48_9PROT|nr:hypothetical protein [uncultured SAR11 cluster alpha proteobacterium H17925_45G17]
MFPPTYLSVDGRIRYWFSRLFSDRWDENGVTKSIRSKASRSMASLSLCTGRVVNWHCFLCLPRLRCRRAGACSVLFAVPRGLPASRRVLDTSWPHRVPGECERGRPCGTLAIARASAPCFTPVGCSSTNSTWSPERPPLVELHTPFHHTVSQS